MKTTLLTLAMILMTSAAIAQANGPDRIIFPHDLHFENEVECATCHEGAWESTAASDRLLPDMDVCADCHDIDDDENCSLCHTNVDEAGDYPRPEFGAGRFGHAAHLVQDLDCAACHGAPAAAHPSLPTKPDCRVCHATADRYTDCRLCHEPGQDLVPADHGAQWRYAHGACARQDEQACYLCHTRTTCAECHAGDNDRPRSHDLNYAYNHALDARGHEADCATCHREPEYCSGCHIAERVLPQDHSRTDWVTSGGGRHATEGLFDIEGCIACHETGAAEPTCARCHQGG